VIFFERLRLENYWQGEAMLDIYLKWLLVLAANFLVLVFILNIILFRPLLAIFKQREDSVKGSLDAAREMNDRKEQGIAGMNRELAEARKKAKEVFEASRSAGLDKQKEVLAEAEAQAAAMLQKAREELRSETEKARQSLKADAERFSEEIVRKLVHA
jgi:F-type H+-transporting ATPase subunit b